jgi:hypothetical protein
MRPPNKSKIGYFITCRKGKVLYPASAFLSSAHRPIKSDRGRKCGHGLRKAGSLASCSSFSSLSKHNRFKIASHQLFRADTTFSFKPGLFSYTAITHDLWSPFFLSQRAQEAWRSLVAFLTTTIDSIV